MPRPNLTLDDLLFVGFNGRVLAADRATGELIWRWTCDRRSYISILPDKDTVFVSCDGYTWALNPADGTELWHQPFKGEGTGIPCLATMGGAMADPSGLAAEKQRRDAEAAAAASGAAT